MGNTLGNQKNESRPHHEKICQKETRREQKTQKISYKIDADKQQSGCSVSDIGLTIEEPSPVTEVSCEFHSVENVLISPDLNTSRTDQHELTLTSSSTHNQHRQVASIQGDFSKTVQIPPNITRKVVHNHTPHMARALLGDCHTKASGSIFRLESQATVLFRAALPTVSPDIGTDTPSDLVSLASPSSYEHQTNENQRYKFFSSLPRADCHHPHFYNHHSDRKYQRFADRCEAQSSSSPSTKMTASTCESISYDDTSTSPTAHTPHRGVEDVLAQLRSSNELQDDVTVDKHVANTTAIKTDKYCQSEIDELEIKSIPMWKTWERSRSLKPDHRCHISAFGTYKKKIQNIDADVTHDIVKRETKDVMVLDQIYKAAIQSDNASSIETIKHDTCTDNSSSIETIKHDTCTDNSSNIETIKHDTCTDNSSNIETTKNQDRCRIIFHHEIAGHNRCESISRRESPIWSQTAAVCILKLEELERSIERTIRDTFPQESFLLTREEFRGSRSLPTTPSLKKKLYRAKDGQPGIAKSGQSDHEDATRFCEETYERAPSASMSPMILRRFGTRTRHASISPKTARVRKATLLNSPSDISNLISSLSAPAAPNGSNYQNVSEQASRPDFALMSDDIFSVGYKSISKYDNVIDFETSDSYLPLHQCRSDEGNRQHVVETLTSEDKQVDNRETATVIIPTLSAVFGSISPKLRRHNQDTCNGSRHSVDKGETSTAAASDPSRFESVDDERLTASLGDKQAIVTVTTTSSLVRLASSGNLISKGHKETRGHFSPPVDDHNEMSQTEKREENRPTAHGSTQTGPVTNQVAHMRGSKSTARLHGGSDNSEEEFRRQTATPDTCMQEMSHPHTVGLSRLLTAGMSPPHSAGMSPPHSAGMSPPHSAGMSPPHSAGMSPPHSASMSPPHSAGMSPPHTAGMSPPHTAGMSPPHTAGMSPPHSAGMSPPHTAGISRLQSCITDTDMQKKFSKERNYSVLDENVSSTKLPDCRSAVQTDERCQAAFRDSPLKKPTDHAALDLAAVLGREKADSGSTSDTQHALNASSYVDCRSYCESQQTSAENKRVKRNNLKSHTETDVVSSNSTQIPHTNTDAVSGNSVRIFQAENNVVFGDDTLLSSGGESLEYGDSKVVSSYSEEVNTRQRKCVSIPVAYTVSSPSLSTCSSSVTGQAQLSSESTGAEDINKHQQLFVCSESHRLLHEGDQQHCSDAHKETVLKHPVSEVISQMISLSQHLLRQHTHPIRQQGHREPLPHKEEPSLSNRSATLLDSCISVNTHSVSSTLTVPSYQQLCQTLEQKPLIAQSIDSENIKLDVNQMCSPDIGKHYVTPASESVHRDDSPDDFGNSKISNSGRSCLFPRSGSDTGMTKDEHHTDLNESEFWQRELIGNRKETRTAAMEYNPSHPAPPASTTSTDQPLKELLQEDNDKNEKTVSTLNTEDEMKEFRESTFECLSGLLESKSVVVEVEIDAFTPDDTNEIQEIDPSRIGDVHEHTESSNAAVSNSSGTSLFKVLTIASSSSSLTTTTSSDFDVDEPSLAFQTFRNDNRSEDTDLNKALDNVKNPSEHEVSNLYELHVSRQPHASRDKKRDSRVYHSDDDVVTGRGIPDYYDDRPLWSRRQKPPGQLSVTMMAVRWRERRDKWLKKRRRNRTDLLSTGSSDTGSEGYPNREYSLLPEHSDCFGDGNYQACTNDLGSGILTSPKYTKPIMPFFNSIHTRCSFEDLSLPLKSRQHGRSRPNSQVNVSQSSRQEKLTDCRHASEHAEGSESNWAPSIHHDVPTNLVYVTSDVEDTFHELCSVQNILEQMQERSPTADADKNQRQFLPLTTENVRSIREYYKYGCLSGLGRRSRLSATDRTESDLDIYSEMPDDVSSGSDIYADDEGDDEGPEMYVPADDNKISCQVSQRVDRCQKERQVATETNVLISRTFYNSRSLRGQCCGQNEENSFDQTASAKKSASGRRIPAYGALNSDEEFWAGSATAMEDGCRQLETTSDAVSSTFQNARVQMHDIQHHLQALRRQMEVMQEDLTNISITLSPDTSVQQTEK